MNVVLVYLLLFVSGSWRYNLSSDKYLILGFLISFLAWFLFSDRKINEKFLLYVVVFAGFLLSLSLYTAGSLSLHSVISSTMRLLLAYFIIKTVGNRFVDAYIEVVVFLAIFSLFGYMSDTFNLFNGIVQRLPRVGDIGYEGIFYLYRFPWHIDRNNSIFFEPGAYQVFLNAALFLLFFARNSFSTKRKWIYIVVLIITLTTTFSTTGFLIFLVLFSMFLYRSDVLSFSGKIKIIGIIIAVVSIFASQFYSTLVVKMSDYLAGQESGLTFAHEHQRAANMLTDIKIFKEHVFGLGHKKYLEKFRVVSRAGAVSSSNGVTRMLALYGLPFSVFIFGSYYLALKRLLNELLLTIGAFFMFMMFLMGESYYSIAPISLAIIASAFIFKQVPFEDEIQSV